MEMVKIGNGSLQCTMATLRGTSQMIMFIDTPGMDKSELVDKINL